MYTLTADRRLFYHIIIGQLVSTKLYYCYFTLSFMFQTLNWTYNHLLKTPSALVVVSLSACQPIGCLHILSVAGLNRLARSHLIKFRTCTEIKQIS